MAGSNIETQTTWSSASSITLSAATRSDSDAFSLGDECDTAAIQVSADNAGTPASGDIVEVYLKYSAGDILGDSGDDYDTDEHAVYLGRLDTYGTNIPGEEGSR